MRTQQRGLWVMLAGLVVAGVMGCQTIVQADRNLIPGSTGGGGTPGDGGGGQGGGEGGGTSGDGGGTSGDGGGTSGDGGAGGTSGMGGAGGG